MTNAEKYLKDMEALMELPSKLRDYIDSKKLGYVTATMITDFFVAEAKPTLTEDERIILRNLNNEIYTVIGRDKDGDLYFDDEDHIFIAPVTTLFGHLFQFIEKRTKI